MSETIENKTFDELAIGDSASVTRALRQDDVETWAAVTGNISLIDLDPGPLDTSIFAHGGGHTMWGASLFATLVGTRLPGPGSVTTAATIAVNAPVPVGVPLTATITVAAKRADGHVVVLDCRLADPAGTLLLEGTVDVIAPQTKIRASLRQLPKVQLRREDRYLDLIEKCAGLPALSCAVVHPCSDDALKGAVDAAARDLITPILVGPEVRIRALAEQLGLDISPFRLIATEHSHRSAEVAVGLVRSGEAQTLMKGSLHTDELLSEVLRKDTGLRTERRLSHCFVITVPTYPRPFIVTDAAINILPSLEDKRDIVQNAIEVARAVGIAVPKVAILSAVETVTPSIPSTIEAAALCKMAERGQIKGGILDGPLALDNAIDEDAARTKGIVSPVAGKADILVVPDLEAGNMLAKQLTFMADAEAAGLVVGARAPIVLTSRADSARTRLASCAVAVLFAEEQRKGLALLKKAAE